MKGPRTVELWFRRYWRGGITQTSTEITHSGHRQRTEKVNDDYNP